MDQFEKNVVFYVRHHTFLVTVLVVSVFVLLGLGEYLLYRKVMLVNSMVSEGLMQLKENTKQSVSPQQKFMMRGGKMMMGEEMMGGDLFLEDGTRIYRRGEVVWPDGSKMMMGEGESLFLK